jgi:hypothetical protein
MHNEYEYCRLDILKDTTWKMHINMWIKLKCILMESVGVEWSHLAQDSVQRRAVVKTVMTLQIPIKQLF